LLALRIFDITRLIAFHASHGKLATLTGGGPAGTFRLAGHRRRPGDAFHRKKPPGDNAFINGGFFVLDPSVVSLIHDDSVSWEGYPLETLAERGELTAYRHNGFWQPMDTMRDKAQLEQLSVRRQSALRV
jgi:glucose-1-phosphate cytidylyltransferase